MATYTLTDGTRKTKLTINGDTTVVFPTKLDYFGVRSLDGADILVSKIKAPTSLEDGVYSTDEGDGDIVIDDGIFTDTLYLKGSGTVVVYGGAKPNHLPFKVGSKGGVRCLGTTTTELYDGSTANPIVINGVSITAKRNDIAFYQQAEYMFNGTTWSAFGDLSGLGDLAYLDKSDIFDNAPALGSTNGVTSAGIYRYTAGQREFLSDVEKGEIFNTYTGSDKNVASGICSHAEGSGTTASGQCSHAEGYNTIASYNFAHAEGFVATASGQGSHAECGYTTASGYCSHAEGGLTTASGQCSHAEGTGTEASATASHASGLYTIANSLASTAIGKYNVADGTSSSDPKHLFIIGNGTDENARSNIVEVDATSLNVNGDIQCNSVSLPTPYTSMPVITADMLGQIAMYVGTTNATYTKGYYYIASSDGQQDPTYSWVSMVDDVPTSGSKNLLPSGAVYDVTPLTRGAGQDSAIGGTDCTASGTQGFCFGYKSSASANTSIALGSYVQANKTGLVAVGRYNSPNIGDIFEVGCGSSSARKNILEATETAVNINGDIQRNGVSIYPLVYDALTESFVFGGASS